MGMDWDEEDLERPQILIDDVWGTTHPGNYHLDTLTKQAGIGVYQSGGKPTYCHISDVSSDKTLNTTTALITEGRFSGFSSGLCIGHVSPEAIDGGPIAVIENDDLIQIDIPNRELNIIGIKGQKRTQDEIIKILKQRSKGVLKRYTDNAVSAMKGAYVE